MDFMDLITYIFESHATVPLWGFLGITFLPPTPLSPPGLGYNMCNISNISHIIKFYIKINSAHQLFNSSICRPLTVHAGEAAWTRDKLGS